MINMQASGAEHPCLFTTS